MDTAKPVISQKEYLKRYLMKDKNKKPKKKKKSNVSSSTHLKRSVIIDDDISETPRVVDDEYTLDHLGDEAPQIVGIVDERPEQVKLLEKYESGRWRPLDEDLKASRRLEEPSEDEQWGVRPRNNRDNPQYRSGSVGETGSRRPDRKDERSDDLRGDRSVGESSKKKKRNPVYGNDSHDEEDPEVPLSRRDQSKNKNQLENRRSRRWSHSKESFSDREDTRKRKESDSKATYRDRRTPPHDRIPRNRDSGSRGKIKHDSYTDEKRKDRDSRNSKSRSHRTERDSCDSDLSPPRKRQDGSDPDLSPSRRAKSGNKAKVSLTRRERSGDSDLAPPRRERGGNDSDVSPDRRRKKTYSSDSEHSPGRKKKRRPDVASSSKRKKKDESDSDLSPPRSRPKGSDSDLSPPRRKNKGGNGDSDLSPPRRNKGGNSDSDLSPPRRNKGGNHDSDLSPPRRNKGYNSDSDLSPPRRKRGGNDTSTSPSRNKGKGLNQKSDKMQDGKKAGLQDANSLKSELRILKEREDEMFRQMDPELLGKTSAAVVRDRKTGLKRDFEKEQAREREKAAKNAVRQKKYEKWGKGLKQDQEQKERVADMIYEMSKPLARYADDEDLDRALRAQEREGDPMLEYIRKHQKESHSIDLTVEGVRRKYQGSYPPNRFNIHPGHRWDGVDRSNGYEQKWFEAKNAKKAVVEEAWKWSSADM